MVGVEDGPNKEKFSSKEVMREGDDDASSEGLEANWRSALGGSGSEGFSDSSPAPRPSFYIRALYNMENEIRRGEGKGRCSSFGSRTVTSIERSLRIALSRRRAVLTEALSEKRIAASPFSLNKSLELL